jgi:hypothetical protein
MLLPVHPIPLNTWALPIFCPGFTSGLVTVNFAGVCAAALVSAANVATKNAVVKCRGMTSSLVKSLDDLVTNPDENYRAPSGNGGRA